MTPGLAGAGGDEAAGATADADTQMVAEAIRAEQASVRALNARNWDSLGALYAEDAILLPPHHEPVRGRAAIVDYLRSMRDAWGEIACGEPLRATASGRLASLADQCTALSGQFRATIHMAFERQSDGVVRAVVDMFGARDPLK